MKFLEPMLFTTLKTYSKEQFIKDVVSGVIVAIIALPLSIALALASGVGPEQGLYTAIIAGFIISFLGGSAVQISGPTAAFATIVAGIVAENGTDGLAVATILAGLILVVMGLFKIGGLIKFIPYTITTGFTSGIAITIVIGQFKDFFGLTYDAGVSPVETMEKLEVFIEYIDTINWWAVLVGVVCLAVLIVWPYINQTIPGSLIAVIVGIILVKVFPIPVNTIGDLYEISNKLPSITIPVFNIEIVGTMLPDALTIAILASVESLLSCVVADEMTGTKHRSNTELVAQGLGNVGSALFGGIPATGAIARTAANVKSGGRTPVAGMVHSVVLVLILIVLMPYAAWIPMPTIAAVLFIVAYNMCQWKTFVHLVKTAPKSDTFVLVTTFVLTVLFDLVIAIEVGMLLACLLFMKRMSEETNIKSWKYLGQEEVTAEGLREIPDYIRVYEITGPMFFGAAEQVAQIELKDFTQCLIIRMRSVPALDITALYALESLEKECANKGVSLIFSHVNGQPLNVMRKAGFVKAGGKENFCGHIDDAIELAIAKVESGK